MTGDSDSISFRIVADLLASRTGQRIDEGRRWRIPSALAGVFRQRGISNLDQLVCLLAQPGEATLADEVVEALLNNETYFFRDRMMFDQLAERVLPSLAQARANRRRLSIWSAGCSTGQEPLSLAMQLRDRPDLWDGWHIDILATDISGKAINAARQGVYSQFEVQRGLGVTQMLKYFTETPRGWKVDPELRSRIRYRVQNLLDPMIEGQKFDLILCRNVLLYFDPGTRSRAFDRISSAMASDGWLMLGAGETANGHTRALRPEPDSINLHRPARHSEPDDQRRARP
ncbi:MAG: protein-glutamate O-methyltransferase CheR [Sphingomonadales bacterium]|nr:protein-glutamate O-methyltransferase CheR [Sphingomonadales bacterium]MBD3774362.1 protein-glutamate O-methyltransferase CheR [Paracoccaceae bacterium]